MERHTGVLRYVCFGGNLGKKEGSMRRVGGITGGAPSSSEGSNSGDGDLERGCSRVGTFDALEFSTARPLEVKSLIAKYGTNFASVCVWMSRTTDKATLGRGYRPGMITRGL